MQGTGAKNNLIAGFVIFLSTSIAWLLSRLDRAFTANIHYQDYKNEIITLIAKPIDDYLQSGDASLPGKITNNIQTLDEQTNACLQMYATQPSDF
ncbi:MAG: hypothetical protein ACPGF7_14065 [Pontibacterium sp.]